MNLLNANRLETRRDLVQRGLFRLLWFTLGSGLIVAIRQEPLVETLYLPAAAVLIAIFGVLTDALRLRYSRVTKSHVQATTLLLIVTVLAIYVAMRLAT